MYSDHQRGLDAAKAKFSDQGCPCSVFQQFPIEITNRRKELLPKMHTLRHQGYRNARVVMDKLYIGNQLVSPVDVPTEEPQLQRGFSARSDFRPSMGPQFRMPVPQQERPQFRP